MRSSRVLLRSKTHKAMARSKTAQTPYQCDAADNLGVGDEHRAALFKRPPPSSVCMSIGAGHWRRLKGQILRCLCMVRRQIKLRPKAGGEGADEREISFRSITYCLLRSTLRHSSRLLTARLR